MQRQILKNKRLITLISGILVGGAFLTHYLLHHEPAAEFMMLIASIIGVLPIALQAYQALRVKVVSIDVLVTIAVIGAFNRLEVWDLATWQAYEDNNEELFAQMDEDAPDGRDAAV